jgi:hypothetical protein
MSVVKSSCPKCGSLIEIPSDLESIVCSACGTLYAVRRLEGSIGLATSPPKTEMTGADSHESRDSEIGRFMAMTDRLALIEEDIESVSNDLELIKSKEQGAPLQFGCAVFGLFGFIVLAMAFFATVGRSFFGGWLFYLAVAAILILSIKGLSKKLMGPAERRALGLRRSRLETILEELHADRDRLTTLLEIGRETTCR